MLAMLSLTVADVITVKLFKLPIPGAIEIVALLGVVVIAFALAYTYALGGHIRVEFLVMRLPRRAQASISVFILMLGLALFAALAWRSYDFARVLQTTGEVSMTQGIPFYPFVQGIALCSPLVCLLLLLELLRSVKKAMEK